MRFRLVAGAAVVAAAILGIYSFTPEHRLAAAAKEDEQAIQKATEDYVAAYNKADLDGVVSLWAPDAEYIDDSGKSTKGRNALQAMFKSAFQENTGTKVRIKSSNLRFVNDVAWQDGSMYVTAPGSAEENSPFTALWTKKDGKWLLTLVRDHPNLAESAKDEPHAQLKDLGWLVGQWVHEEKEIKTTINAKWMKGQRFLIVDLVVTNKGEETISLIQVIGWDPTGNQLHSWVFDTRGGFGEGYWSRKGDTWTANVAGITADGRKVTGTNVWKKVDDRSFVFEGTDRDVDGVALPDVKITYQRELKAK